MDSKQTLSEISHLFLSEMRQRQAGPAARPNRVPPAPQNSARNQVAEDLIREEFAAELNADTGESADPSQTTHSSKSSEISVVLASHLPDQPKRVRQYARHLAAQGGRIGLIEVDGGEFIVTCFEPGGGGPADESAQIVDELDGRRMNESLAELSFDVDRWLICLLNPKTTEAREILRLSARWVLLTTADHDGVVATYRALKGVSEQAKPRLSLAVLDARSEGQAAAVFQKLSAVASQFLSCRMQPESPVADAPDVQEQIVLHCRSTRDKSPHAAAPQWKILSDFLSSAASGVAQPIPPLPQEIPPAYKFEMPREESESISSSISSPIPMTTRETGISEVIDLPADGEETILEAIIRRGGAAGEWVQCPLKAPPCPNAVLAVGRDHRLVLVAVAGRGLNQLRSIGLALRWMNENRELIQMALPQLAIDAEKIPSVRLLVDHADLSAEQLQPLLHSEAVSVQAYRRIKWGAKRGLLLEAA
jgi:hypothetical protein